MDNFTNEEKNYYELLVDALDDGKIDASERNILNKRKEKYGISDERAKEIEDFTKREYLESKTPQFETDGERDYYDLLVDMLDDGVIDESERNILNKRKEKYQISDERAKELENFAKDMNTQNKICKGINTTNNNLDNIESEQIKIIKKSSMILLDTLNSSDEENIRENCLKAFSEFKWMHKILIENYNNYPKEYNEFAKKLVVAFYEIGDYDCVIGITKKLSKYCSNKYVMEAMGKAYTKIQAYEKSKNAFKTLVSLDEEDDYAWFLLADAYLTLEDYDNAIDCYEKAININNSIAVYWNNYGVSLERVNRLEESKNAYKIAAELDPNEKIYRNNVNKSTVRKIVKGIGDLFNN